MFLITLLGSSIFSAEPMIGTINLAALSLAVAREGWVQPAKVTASQVVTSPVKPRDSSTADSYIKQGAARISQEDYAGAIADLSRGIQLNPNHSSAYYHRGFAFFQLGRYKESIEDLSRSIQLNPNDAVSYIQRGDVYQILGDYRSAIADFTRVIQLNPRLAHIAHTSRGLAYMKLTNHRAANQDFSSAIQLSPNFAVAYLYRSATWKYLGEGERSSQDLRRALELDPTIFRLIRPSSNNQPQWNVARSKI